jgi:spermidine/putrescine transport system ATP-binding protein
MKRVIVRLEDFGKSFFKKEVIKHINLDIYENEFITLLGSSGCGKTTILRSISGLDKPTTGKVYIDEVDVTDMDPTKREVNTIFQNYALFPLMTVYDNIAFGLRMKKVDEEEIKTRVNEMLELVHLTGYEKRFPRELSGGEAQRVSLARGLINRPKVLLLDEPLSALDLKLRKEMQIELKRLQRKLKITFIYVTHDQDEALSMSNRIAVVRGGKIEQVGTPSYVYDHPSTLYVATFVGEANVFDAEVKKINKEKKLLYLGDNFVSKYSKNKYSEGDKVKVVIRPENIKISRTLKKENSLKGVVDELIYDGSNTKLMVDVDGMIVKVLVFGNDHSYEVGDKLYLYWDNVDMNVFGEKDER